MNNLFFSLNFSLLLIASFLPISAGGAPAEPSSQTSSGETILVPAGLEGSWAVNFSCSRPVNDAKGILQISNSSRSDQSSLMIIIMNSSYAMLSFQNEISADGNGITLTPRSWEAEQVNDTFTSFNIEPMTINATLDDSGYVLNGDVETANNCNGFHAMKYPSLGSVDGPRAAVDLSREIRPPTTQQRGGILGNISSSNAARFGIRQENTRPTLNRRNLNTCLELFRTLSTDEVRYLGSNSLGISSLVSDDAAMLTSFGKTYDDWNRTDARSLTLLINSCKAHAPLNQSEELIALNESIRPLESLHPLTSGLSTDTRRRNNNSRFLSRWAKHFFSVAASRAARNYATYQLGSITSGRFYPELQVELEAEIQELRTDNAFYSYMSPDQRESYIESYNAFLAESRKMILEEQAQSIDFDVIAADQGLISAFSAKDELVSEADELGLTELSRSISVEYLEGIANSSASEASFVVEQFGANFSSVTELTSALAEFNQIRESYQYFRETDAARIEREISNKLQDAISSNMQLLKSTIGENISLDRNGLDQLNAISESLFVVGVDEIETAVYEPYLEELATTMITKRQEVRLSLAEQEREAALRQRGVELQEEENARLAELAKYRKAIANGYVYKPLTFWPSYATGHDIGMIFNGERVGQNIFMHIHNNFINAYSDYCAHLLPENSAVITTIETTTTRTLSGIRLRERSEVVDTIYIDPKSAITFNQFSDDLYGIDSMGEGVLFSLDFAESVNRVGLGAAANQAFGLGLEARSAVYEVFEEEACESAIVVQLYENLFRFANDISSLQENNIQVPGSDGLSTPPPEPGDYSKISEGCIDHRGFSLGAREYCTCLDRAYSPVFDEDEIRFYANNFQEWRTSYSRDRRLLEPLLQSCNRFFN